ncbi:DUF6074 family protein [Agrobacterium sp. 22-211-1]
MSDRNQLDLFDVSRPAAKIFAFPLSRQVGRARIIAERIFNGPHNKAQSAYNRATRQLVSELSEFGFDSDAIDAELSAFTEVVNAEISILLNSEHRGVR